MDRPSQSNRRDRRRCRRSQKTDWMEARAIRADLEVDYDVDAMDWLRDFLSQAQQALSDERANAIAG